jgi:hypothetical protein
MFEGWQDAKYQADVLGLSLEQIGDEYALLSQILFQHGAANFGVIGQHFWR